MYQTSTPILRLQGSGKITILSCKFKFRLRSFGVHVTSSSFEGFGVGFILFFLQSLTNPNAPIQTGFGWFDVWILGVLLLLSASEYVL